MKLRLFFLFSFSVLISSAYSVETSEQANAILFVTNISNPVSTVTSAELRDFYFKRKRTWPDGTSVRFIDRSADSVLRKIFLSRFIGKSSEEVDLFWIGQKLYSGDSAPLQEATDSMTLQFVSSFKGAVGYVSPAVFIPQKFVKVLRVEER